MNSSDLSREQIQAIQKRIESGRIYLRRLSERMHNRGFPPDDKLLVLASEAHATLDWLWVELHYRNCKEMRGGDGKSCDAGAINPGFIPSSNAV